MRSFTALALVLTLCLLLVAPSTLAAEPRSRGFKSGDLLSSLWSFLLPWWGAESVHKAGMTMDPLGGTREATSTTKEGMIIDPLGGTQDSDPTTDEGMGMDPLGNNQGSDSTTDAGMGIDPLG